jgi:8-oxo-dGTP pyrophosphatase MutT (NUDIX family)
VNFRIWLQETGDLNSYGIDDQDNGKFSRYRPPKEPLKKTRMNKKIEKLFKGESKDLKDSGAGCIFTDGENILMLLRSSDSEEPHKWGIPIGHAKDGESPMRTATRETKEEIGVNLNSLNLKKIGVSLERGGKWTVFIFKVNKKFSCKLNHEHDDYKWIKIKDLKNYSLHPLFKKRMGKYISIIEKSDY